MTAPSAGARLIGIDLARFVAVAGMVLVHAQSDIVLPRLVAASGGNEVMSPPAAWYLELVQSIATNRARLLFLLLAGVGVSLLAQRRGARTLTLLRRAAFLLVLGVLLLVSGWSDLVLLFYAVLFVLAPVLLWLPSQVLLGVAVAFVLPAAVGAALDLMRDADLTGVLLILGEAIPLFCLGMAVGRLELTDVGVVKRLGLVGVLLSVPGLFVLGARGGLDVATVDGPWELVAATTSTAGLCLVVIAGCLALPRRLHGKVLSPVALAGGMPLTAYVGHALLFPRVATSADLALGAATAIAVGYLAGTIIFAVLWRRRGRSGPVEAALRWASGS